MKPHPRIRTAIKWGGAAVTVLLVVGWIGSGWHSLQYLPPGRGEVSLQYGCFMVSEWRLPHPPALCGARFIVGDRFGMYLWLVHYHSPAGGIFANNHWATFVPLWFAWMPLGITTAAAWRLDTRARRRARLNLCPKCNYDRTGLAASAKCPECGAAAS